ncbi:hypothetical protein SAMN04488557_0158 [Hyphomicrobium facile]|uniref:Uncharacterized protein n=1 Tax=Hyphomicrobium facile TaxID=51670 RepID=A0A1I7MTU5_9HYPH|nr:hypothetical protein SAMN04488557_0158 [Hyphomicrobium facile]
MEDHTEKPNPSCRPPRNKGKLIGAKPPLRPSHVWSRLGGGWPQD